MKVLITTCLLLISAWAALDALGRPNWTGAGFVDLTGFLWSESNAEYVFYHHVMNPIGSDGTVPFSVVTTPDFVTWSDPTPFKDDSGTFAADSIVVGSMPIASGDVAHLVVDASGFHLASETRGADVWELEQKLTIPVEGLVPRMTSFVAIEDPDVGPLVLVLYSRLFSETDIAGWAVDLNTWTITAQVTISDIPLGLATDTHRTIASQPLSRTTCDDGADRDVVSLQFCAAVHPMTDPVRNNQFLGTLDRTDSSLDPLNFQFVNRRVSPSFDGKRMAADMFGRGFFPVKMLWNPKSDDEGLSTVMAPDTHTSGAGSTDELGVLFYQTVSDDLNFAVHLAWDIYERVSCARNTFMSSGPFPQKIFFPPELNHSSYLISFAVAESENQNVRTRAAGMPSQLAEGCADGTETKMEATDQAAACDAERVPDVWIFSDSVQVVTAAPGFDPTQSCGMVYKNEGDTRFMYGHVYESTGSGPLPHTVIEILTLPHFGSGYCRPLPTIEMEYTGF